MINYFIHFYKLASITSHDSLNQISIQYSLHMWIPHNPQFQLQVTTWSRDVHGLFDYKAPHAQYKTTTHQISNQCRIYRNSIHNEQFFDIGKRTLPKYYDYVCEPQKSENYDDQKFTLRWNPPKRDNESKQLFKVARQPYLVLKDFITKDTGKNQQFEGYPLQIGNIIKLGLIHFTVKEIVSQSTLQPLFPIYQEKQNNRTLLNVCNNPVKHNNLEEEDGQPEAEGDNSQTRVKKRIIKKESLKNQKLSSKMKERMEMRCMSDQQSSQIMNEEEEEHLEQKLKGRFQREKQSQQIDNSIKEECRFCLSQEDNPTEDPFISPCECKGSVGRVHLGCFMHWVNSKLSFTQKNMVKTYTLQKNQCEICQKPYPESVKAANKLTDLVKIEKPQGPYAILKCVKERQLENEAEISYIMIPGTEGKAVTVGRSENNEIKINDISISRNHCEIFFRNGQFFVKDLGSKFGTLLKFQRTHHFDFHPAQIQIGRIAYKIAPLRKSPFQDEFEEELSDRR